MIDKIRSLIFPQAEKTEISALTEEIAVVVAALLLEIASIDGEFDEEEQVKIAHLLVKRFQLNKNSVNSLIEEAKKETDRASDLFGFTRKINKAFDHDRRVDLVRMLWEVVYADGVSDNFEANLMRRLSGLLNVSDRESGEERKKVLEEISLTQ